MIVPRVRNCKVCRLPRPLTEASCRICGSADFNDRVDASPDSLALRLIGEDRLDIAWASLEDEVSRGAESAGTCLLLAWLAHAFRDERAVETWSHESLRLSPESPEPHLLLGKTLQRAERWAEAAAEYEIALRQPAVDPQRRELLKELRADCLARIPEF